MNVAIALAVIFSQFIAARIRDWSHADRLLSTIAYTLIVLPTVSATWVGGYLFTTEVTTCRLEGRWSLLFRKKEESTIKAIQTALCCCGLNSKRDRAWPFPSRDVDAYVCERTSGFSVPCGPLWQHRLIIVAALNMFASIVLEIAAVTTPRLGNGHD